MYNIGVFIFAKEFAMPQIETLPLTKEIAEKLGHIAWIEEADPVIAFRRMKEALAQNPTNCAVWVQATTESKRETVGQWRNAEQHRFLSGEYGDGAHKHFERPVTSVAAARNELTRQFNAAAKPCPGLADHMKQRLEQLFEAFPGYKIRFQLRAGADDKARQKLAEHVDGGETTRLRFLECLSGPGTLLFRNEDMRMLPARGDISLETQRLPEHGNFTAYEAPAGCIVLLSNDRLPWQPLLHSEPVAKQPEAPQRRTVTTYDCYK